MNLHTLLEILDEADAENWSVIVGGGHTYRDEHHGTAVHIPDLNLTAAWGRHADGEASGSEEPWWDLLDKTVYRRQIDFFWCGSLVHRVEYAAPDGGRCVIPWPDYNLTVDRHELQVVRLLDGLQGGSIRPIETTLEMAKLTVRQ